MLFRFDDVCINTNLAHLERCVQVVRECVKHVHVQCAVSLVCNDVEELAPPQDEFVFQPIYKAYSAVDQFYRVDKVGRPTLPEDVQVTSHGIVHADHRLMSRGAQELSILTSCSLLETSVFTPPFNKWNDDTVGVCIKHGVKLQRFEDGWRSAEYNRFDPKVQFWYAHSRALRIEDLERWFQS